MNHSPSRKTWPLVAAVLVVLALAFLAWWLRLGESSRRKLQPATGPAKLTGGQPPTDQPATAQPPTGQPPTEQPPTEQPPTVQPLAEVPLEKRIENWVAVLKAPHLRLNVQRAFQLEKGIKAGGEEAIARLLELLKDEENPIVRSWMVRLLGEFGSKTPRAELARLVRADPVEDVRVCAATALGLIGDESVLGALNEAALEDYSRAVNNAARKAIEAIETRLKPK